jgi:hypothetical protein
VALGKLEGGDLGSLGSLRSPLPDSDELSGTVYDLQHTWWSVFTGLSPFDIILLGEEGLLSWDTVLSGVELRVRVGPSRSEGGSIPGSRTTRISLPFPPCFFPSQSSMQPGCELDCSHKGLLSVFG